MRQTLLLCALVGYVIAVPAGNFHQEYTYKASSSSFKNNELQHRTDDQGYYKKDGDLEGRTKPRVDANSEHSEYVNPNLRGNLYGGYGESTDMNSYGLMNAQSGVSGYGTNQLAEGIASSDRIVGSRGYTAGSSNYGSSNYGMSNYDSNYGSSGYGSSGYQSSSYGSSSNIQSIIQRLQQDFEREIQNQRWRDTYAQAAYDQTDLERQLRRNLTDRLNSELVSRYGQQTIKNGLSYSIADGHVQSAANYNNQELVNLRQQLENNLLSRLRTQYNQGYGTSGTSSHYESHSESQRKYGYTSSTVRPSYQTLYPRLPVYTTTQSSITNNYAHSNYEVINSNTRYTPVVNPESISTIASSVQSQLDNTLNQVLDDIYRQHFSSSASYQLTNYDVVLNRIQNELRNNITYLLDEHVRRNYGSQTQRDGYFYSIGPNGQISENYNYALRDLEQLKAQVERNLIEKLNRQFETYRSRYTSQSQSYSSQSNYGSYDRYATTPRYIYSSTPYVYSTTQQYTTPRSQYYSKGGHDQYLGGSRQSGYGMSGGSSYSSGTYSSANMGQLQRQLQDELSRQLQTAIRRDSSLYSSSGTYSPQNYQSSLQHLTDELNRNVTRHLQEFSGSASYSASGNYDQAQIESMRSELLSSLTRQLQQNLQQHFASSSVYSSSGSSNYRPVRGFSNYPQGQYRSGGSVVVGEDCDHDTMAGLRMKRSPYQPYRSRPLSYYQSSDYSHGSSHNYHHNYHHNAHYGYSGYRTSVPETPNNERNDQEVEETGQQEMDLGQQVEDIEYIPPQSHQRKPQKFQEENNGQKIQEDEFEPLQTGQQQEQYDVGQQTVEVGQETVGEEFENVHLGSHHEVGQETDDSELTQQLEIGQPQIWNSQEPHVQAEYNLQTGNQYKPVSGNIHQEIGQEVDESDLTQQIEEFDSLQVGPKPQALPSQNVVVEQEPHVQAEYITPQTGQQYKPVPGNIYHEVGQQVDDSDLTQQVEEFDNHNLLVEQKPHALPSLNMFSQQEPHVQAEYNTLQTNQQYKPVTSNIHQNQQHEIGQEVDDTDLTQQVEEVGQQSEQNLLGQLPDDSEGPLVNRGYQSNSVAVNPVLGNWQSPDQIDTSGKEKVVQTTIGQELEHPELTQQIEEFEPIPKDLPSTIQSDNQNQQTDFRGVNQQFEQSTFNIPKNPQVFDQQKARWISHKWKPNQDRFIESAKQRLLMKQEARLRTKQISYSDSDEIFNEITANVERELKSYNSHFLTNYLDLTGDEIEGIEIIICGYLREKFDEFQKFNQQLGTNRNIGQTFYGTSQQGQTISSDNLQLGQIPEDNEQRPEEIDELHAQVGVAKVNKGDLTNSGFQYDSLSLPENQDWYLTTWTEKQKAFVSRLHRKVLLRFIMLSHLGQLKNYTETEMNKKLSQEIGNEIARYNDYFLFKYLGFYEYDLKYIKENISLKLRDRWVEDIRINNNDSHSRTQQSYHNFQNNRAHQNVEQQTNNNLTPEQDLLLDNQQPVKVETQPEQASINFNDNSQIVKNQFVEPLNAPQPLGHNSLQNPLGEKQYPSKPFVMQHSGANSNYGSHGVTHQQPQRRPSLPDSRAFIDREVGYAHRNDLMYSPTLNKVLEEENLKPTPGFENNSPPSPLPNQPQQPVQQETVNQQPDGIGRVSLQKSYGQWPGLSSQGQVMTNQQTLKDDERDAERDADRLIQLLKEKQTRPLVQVVEQPVQTIGSSDVNNNNYGVVDQTSRRSYSSVLSQESSYGFQANGNRRYDGKLNYGRQEEEQQNVETTGNIQPLHYDKANEVHQREPLSPGNSLLGVKGYRKSPQRTIEATLVETPGLVVAPSYSSTAQPELVSEIQETTIANTIDENLPWWKRVGNKIKQGATDLKKKIVG